MKMEEVIKKLRQADTELGKGNSVAGVCRLLGVTDAMYFRWRKHYNTAMPHSALGSGPRPLKRSLPARPLIRAIRPGSSVQGLRSEGLVRYHPRFLHAAAIGLFQRSAKVSAPCQEEYARMRTTPYPSIAAIGDRVHRLIGDHIHLMFREILTGTGAESDHRFVCLVTGEPHPLCNFACMDDPTDLEGAKAAIGPLLDCRAPSAVLFPCPVPAAVEQELSAAGFQRQRGLLAMAIDIERLGSTAIPAGYTFARVATAAHRDSWADAFARGYELPLGVGGVISRGISEDTATDSPVQYFWILKDGKPVSTSMLYLKGGVAGIYCVATLAEERGKGLGAFATAEPLRTAQGLGYRVGVLQSSEEGHPIYRRIGFADFGELPLFVRIPD